MVSSGAEKRAIGLWATVSADTTGMLFVVRSVLYPIRHLHQRYRGAGSPPDSCSHCNGLAGYEVPWPCPTIRVLDRKGADQW